MFDIGDKVRKRDGGHRMTVEEIGTDCVFCRWIEGREEKKEWFDVPDLLGAPSVRGGFSDFDTKTFMRRSTPIRASKSSRRTI